MKSITAILFLLVLTPCVFGAVLSYPGELLRNDPFEEDAQSLFPAGASGNAVTVDYVPDGKIADPDSVFAGFTQDGASEKNKLVFKNGRVTRYVLGGFSLQGDVKANSVVFSDGLAADAAIAKLCGGQTKNGDANENSATISGGRIVGDVYGGDADGDGNASENSVKISNGKFSGFVNGGGVSGVGIARKNRVAISGGTVAMGVAGGFAHVAGVLPVDKENKKDEEKTNSVLENVVKISGRAEIDGNVSGGFVLDSNGSVKKNTVDISGGTIRGTVYGGRAFNGEASGNTVVISGGAIKDRNGGFSPVYAGFVEEAENNGRAIGNAVVISGSPALETITLHGNNLPTWKTDGNTLSFKGFRGTIHGLSRFQDIEIDRESVVTVDGDGPHEIFNLNNRGRIVFKNGKATVHGKVDGNPIE